MVITYTTALTGAGNLCVGNYDGNTAGGAVLQSEVVAFSSVFSTDDRKSVQASQGAYYGVTVADSGAVNSAGNGVWTSSDTSVATVGSSTGVVTGIATGTATITFTLTDANSCAQAVTKAITVNPLPVMSNITGTTTVCVNGTTLLSNATTGTKAWSSSTPAVATINSTSGTVTGVAAGTTTITCAITDVSGCTNTITTTVTVNGLPGAVSGNNMAAISGTTTICAPGAVATSTTQLTHSVSGGVWTSSDVNKATVDASSGLVTAVASGTATITYTLTSAEGCTNTKTIAITINPVLVPSVSIIASASTICLATSVTFTATPTNGGTPTYQWQKME